MSRPSRFALAAIACVSLDATGRITNAVLRSTKQERPGIVTPDIANRAAVLVDSLSRLDFPDTAAGSFGEAVLKPPRSDDGGTR